MRTCLLPLCTIMFVMLFTSCQKEPLELTPLATLNIELVKKYSDEGIVSKSQVTDFEATVSIAYEDDTVVYDSRFVTPGVTGNFGHGIRNEAGQKVI